MEETVVVANEYFSKTCCPEPSALEKFKWGPNGEFFPRVLHLPD